MKLGWFLSPCHPDKFPTIWVPLWCSGPKKTTKIGAAKGRAGHLKRRVPGRGPWLVKPPLLVYTLEVFLPVSLVWKFEHFAKVINRVCGIQTERLIWKQRTSLKHVSWKANNPQQSAPLLNSMVNFAQFQLNVWIEVSMDQTLCLHCRCLHQVSWRSTNQYKPLLPAKWVQGRILLIVLRKLVTQVPS